MNEPRLCPHTRWPLLPQQPDCQTLRLGKVHEFRKRCDADSNRVMLTRKRGAIGDLLVLADEAPTAALRAEAWIKAAEGLRRAEHFGFALEQLERGLEGDPTNLTGLREKAICLHRLALMPRAGHSLDRAREHCRDVLKLYPNDTATWALLGWIDQDAWRATWRIPGNTSAQMRHDAVHESALLRTSIGSYTQGYRRTRTHHCCGIHALMLMHVYRHLTNDPRYDRELATLGSAVREAAESGGMKSGCSGRAPALLYSKS